MADTQATDGHSGRRTPGSTRRARLATVLCLCASGCYDRRTEALAVERCERLLTAQELDGMVVGGASAAIRPKDEPRIRDGDRTIFVRRSYDRPRRDGATGMEARDYTCIFDKRLRKVTTLSTNGHEQEFLMGDSEWLAARGRSSSRQQEPAPVARTAAPR